MKLQDSALFSSLFGLLRLLPPCLRWRTGARAMSSRGTRTPTSRDAAPTEKKRRHRKHSSGSSKSKSAAAGAGGKGGADVNTVAYAAIKNVLAKSGGSISPAEAKKVAFPDLVKDKSLAPASRNEVLALITSDEWLTANQGPDSGFVFADGVISA